MATHHLGHGLHGGLELLHRVGAVVHEAHIDKDRGAQLQGLAVQHRAVAGDQAAVFQAFEAAREPAPQQTRQQADDTIADVDDSAIVEAIEKGDKARVEKLQAKIDRYESDPEKGEGKKELLAKAQAFEAARDQAAKHSPWLTFASMAFQLAIVLLSASIISVNEKMYKFSEVVAVLGILLLGQGIWLWF